MHDAIPVAVDDTDSGAQEALVLPPPPLLDPAAPEPLPDELPPEEPPLDDPPPEELLPDRPPPDSGAL